MPRDKDLLGTIEAQARHVLGLLEEEIAELEERLGKLKEQHARWSSVLSGAPTPTGSRRGRPPKAAVTDEVQTRKRARKAPKPAGPAIDWNEVLKGLPSRFGMAEIAAATPELDPNPRARIVAVARWTRAKQLKKTGSGQYEKVAERSRKRAEAAASEAGPAESDAEAPRHAASDSEVENSAA